MIPLPLGAQDRPPELGDDLDNALDVPSGDASVECNDTLSLISTFPPEVLLAIFVHVVETQRPRPPVRRKRRDWVLRQIGANHDGGSTAQDEIREPEFLGGRGGSLGWLALGHVCYLWREIILTQPLFWARDIGSLPLGTADMLERAGDAPLTLRLYTSSYRKGYEHIVALVKGNDTYLRRLREIDLVNTLYDALEREPYRRFLTKNKFLALERLSVYANEAENPDWFAAPTVKAPLLLSAHFTNHVLAIPYTDTLRELTITRVNRGGGPKDYYLDSEEQYVILVSSNPENLTHLNLAGVLDEHLPGMFSDEFPGPGLFWREQISFPNMQHMQISASRARHVLAVLRGSILPETALLSLTIDFREYAAETAIRIALSAVLDACPLRQPEPTGILILDDDTGYYNGRPSHYMRIELYTASHSDVSVNREPSCSSDSFSRQAHRLSLHFHFQTHHENIDSKWTLGAFLDMLASHTSLDTVHTLSYQGSCDSCAPSVDRTLLARFPNVRNLNLADAHSRCSRVMSRAVRSSWTRFAGLSPRV